ncbi:MAG TPA: 50S ribosomal protein L29 [Actinomycetota bacterium]|nr:50S ribosomal protein L29 [Actinomycetota bacterium]
MKASELKDMADDELATKLGEAKEELFNLRFQLVTGQLDNPMRLGQVRKDIARIMTTIREREIAAAEAAGVGAEAGEAR